MSPVLSILIPTLVERRHFLARLMKRLGPQLDESVVVRTLEDKGEDTIGGKRQRLLEESETPYVAFIDDDDLVSPDYCRLMLAGIETGADVIGFRLKHYTDSYLTGLALLSMAAENWRAESHLDGLTRYFRTPNHLNPIRREMALSIGYESWNSGEDSDYSKRLYAAHGATMRECFVDRYVYDYLFRVRLPVPDDDEYDRFGRLTRGGAERAIIQNGFAVWRGFICTSIDQLD